MVINRLIWHRQKLTSIISGILGVLFIASAFLKFHALRAFQGEVRLFLEVYFPAFFWGHERLLAVSTCVLELIMGICATIGIGRKRLSIAYVIMLSFFVWLTGINLFFPSLMGSIESCGCFGELIHFTPGAAFFKSIIFDVMAIFWFFLEFFVKGRRMKDADCRIAFNHKHSMH